MRIRKFRRGDAAGTSRCIVKTLRESNAKYYPQRVIRFLIKNNRPAELVKSISKGYTLVAEVHGRIIGVVRLWTDGWICAFFIDPQYQQQGIGTRLLRQIERIAKKKGFEALRTHSAINSVAFYKKKGYRVVRQVVLRDCGRVYRMFKRL